MSFLVVCVVLMAQLPYEGSMNPVDNGMKYGPELLFK